MSLSNRMAAFMMALVTAAVLAVVQPATADGCDECPPGGSCVWNSCNPDGEGCWECEYVCDQMTCYYNTCTGTMDVCTTQQ